ncbi:AvrD family protein [Streptomyces sp. SP17BM10]|uniref:AvrD family protein n=1 Tax=Streptomyces sp. SP17BM10 TaxID=3002530 RepID=UPI002E766A15|nr:AvrD family protein [Streptomyces sp. SP17BM10]MEE1784155.1 AvrD family protein [Streptomyces sp. SP17BM10]
MATIGTGPERISYRSIDDVLGPREKRFFGEGFKRAEHRVRALRVTAGADGVPQVGARVGVGYPVDWSRKGDTDQRPHLSTVDVLAVGAQLAEVQLAHVLGLGAEQRGRALLERVRIKAGTSPVEDDLEDFPASARLVETRRAEEAENRFTTTVDCRVGTLRARYRISHEEGAGNTGPGFYESPEELLGDSRPRLFGEGFRFRRQLVGDVDVEIGRLRAQALVRVETGGGAAQAGAGLEGAHHASASPIDCFVIGLQLGQLLLYALDDLPRARSDTLWMRETVLELDPLRRRIGALEPTSARLERTRLLTNGKGETWRSADIVGDFCGVGLRCAVAHRIPSA